MAELPEIEKAIMLREIEKVKAELKRIAEEIEETKTDFCDHYCKHPYIWDEEKEGCELCESEICKNCPLGRL